MVVRVVGECGLQDRAHGRCTASLLSWWWRRWRHQLVRIGIGTGSVVGGIGAVAQALALQEERRAAGGAGAGQGQSACGEFAGRSCVVIERHVRREIGTNGSNNQETKSSELP